MTRLLEQAFDVVAKLSDKDQDAVAAFILDELTSEKRWSETFASSQSQLAALGAEALREFQAHQTRPMDMSRDFTHD